MADWKRLAKALILADEVIEEREAEIVRRELLADGVINKTEAEFLVDLRNSATRAVPKFHAFVFEVVKKAVLADGDVSPAEAEWLRKFVLADGKVDEAERAFLADLKRSARKTCPEFEALLRQYGV